MCRQIINRQNINNPNVDLRSCNKGKLLRLIISRVAYFYRDITMMYNRFDSRKSPPNVARCSIFMISFLNLVNNLHSQNQLSILKETIKEIPISNLMHVLHANEYMPKKQVRYIESHKKIIEKDLKILAFLRKQVRKRDRC